MAAIDLLGLPAGLELGGPYAFVATGDGDVVKRFLAAGPSTALVDTLLLSGIPADLQVHANGALFWAQPDLDGIEVLRFGAVESYCGPANLNSTGTSAEAGISGWPVAGAPITLTARGMPPGRKGYFLVAAAQGFVPFPPGSQGNLCLSGPIGRFRDHVATADGAGAFEVTIDTTALPLPSGRTSVQSGESWYFQAWFRDANPGPTSNSTDGTCVRFE